MFHVAEAEHRREGHAVSRPAQHHRRDGRHGTTPDRLGERGVRVVHGEPDDRDPVAVPVHVRAGRVAAARRRRRHEQGDLPLPEQDRAAVPQAGFGAAVAVRGEAVGVAQVGGRLLGVLHVQLKMVYRTYIHPISPIFELSCAS